MPRPRFQPPVRRKEPEVPAESWVKKAIRLGEASGEALSRATARQALAMADPGSYRRFEELGQAGMQVPTVEYMKSARRAVQPGWQKSSAGDEALALMAGAAEAPLGAALGAVGTAVGSRVPLPGAGLVGGALGRSLGWAGARGLSELANPESAGRNLWWDVAGVAGAKALGTAGSVVYRKALQPKLAEAGTLAARPRLAKVLNWAESAMDPAIGPAASNYGLPRWANRRLQRMGPQGIRDVTQTRGAIQGRLAARMGQAGPAGVQTEMPLQGQRRLSLQPHPVQQELGLPIGHMPDRGLGPFSQSQALPFPKEVIQEGLPGMQARQRVKTLRSALDELPPVPEANPTITQVVRRYDEATQGPLKGHLPGVEPAPVYGPEPVPPVNQVGTKRIGGAPAEQFAPQRFGTRAGQPARMPLGAQAGGPEPPTGFEPTGWTRPPQGPGPAPESVEAASKIYATVARSGEPLTWKQYAKGLQEHTGMTRKEWVSVLRVHQGLARAYGEDMDTMIGRMFRGVTSETQQKQMFPGRQMPGNALGLAHFMEDQRAILSFADRMRVTGYSNSRRVEVALHEPIHVFLRWMPQDDLDLLAKHASRGKSVTGFTEGTEHTIVKWLLEYLKGGQAPTPKLQRVFQRFNAWITSLITRGRPIKPSPEVRQVFTRMFTPGAYTGRLGARPTVITRSPDNVRGLSRAR